jgi:hypothetical protein
MTTPNTNNPEPRAVGLRFARNRLIVELADAREVFIPLTHYPTLHKARPAQRNNWKKLGQGFHWPSLDLDLSVRGLVSGLPEVIPAPPTLRAKSMTQRHRRAT